MTKLNLHLIVIALSVFGLNETGKSFALEMQPDTLKLDLESSVINWRGTDMGGMHEGTIQFQEGSITTVGGKVTGGYFKVDMHSIEVTDMPANEVQARRNLTEHLESEDFFLVEEFPVSSFTITSAEYHQNDSLLISGDLTIRDRTKNITFTAIQHQHDDGSLSFETTFIFDRFEWNVAYQGSFWNRITSIIDNNLVHAGIRVKSKLHFYGNAL